jgi:methionyl-tRNA formyltransferase
MQIVPMGTVEFSLPVLEHLLTLDVEMVGVCTLTKPKFNADQVNLTSFCTKHGITGIYADDINSTSLVVDLR